MKDILASLGLTENEKKVYLGLHKNPLKTGAMLSRILNMDKSSVYRAMVSLSKRGLVIASFNKAGITYEASNPETLNELFTEKKMELEKEKGLLGDFIEKLKNESESSRNTYFVIEHGVEALRARMEESLQSEEKLIREKFMFHPIFEDTKHLDFVRDHRKKRIAKKIFLRGLDSKKDIERFNKVFPDFAEDREKAFKEVRRLPEEIKDTNSFRIWDSTINILSYDKNGEFIVVTIKDPYIVNLMKSFYDFVWNKSLKVI